MNKRDFERLKNSLREMIAVESGDATAKRETVYDGNVLVEIKENGKPVWNLSSAAKELSIVLGDTQFEDMSSFIKTVRMVLRQTQAGFADLMGVPLSTLKGWEQGRREPRGSARRLLTITIKYPAAVFDTLSDPNCVLEF